MKKIKGKRYRIIVISTIVSLLLILGVTYAWFTSNTSFTYNSFQTVDYDMDINIYESGRDSAGYKEDHSVAPLEGINEDSSYIRTIINQEQYFAEKMPSNYKIIEIKNTSNTDFIYSVAFMFEEIGENSIEYIKLADFYYDITDVTTQVGDNIESYVEGQSVIDKDVISAKGQVLNTVNYDGSVIEVGETIYLRFDYAYVGSEIESTSTLTINALFDGRDSLNTANLSDSNSYYEVSDYNGLVSALENVKDDGTIVLTKNIIVYNSNLSINKRITLDLNGFDLEVQGNLTFDYFSEGEASVICDKGSKLTVYGNIYISTPATYFRFLGDANDNLLLGYVVNGKVTGGEIIVDTRYDSQLNNRGLYMNSVQAKKITTDYEYTDLANMQLTDYSFVVIGSNSEIGKISAIENASKIAIYNYGYIEDVDLSLLYELEVAINQIYIKNYLTIENAISLPTFAKKYDNTRIIATVNSLSLSVVEDNSIPFTNNDIELDGYSGESVVYLGNNAYQINKFYDTEDVNKLFANYLATYGLTSVEVDTIYIYTYYNSTLTQDGLKNLVTNYEIENVDLTQTIMEDNSVREAFKGLDFLESVSLPVSVTLIEDEAFLGCSSLHTIVFEGDIETVGAAAFDDEITLLIYWMDENIDYLYNHIDEELFPQNTNYFLDLTSAYEYLKEKYTVDDEEFFRIYPSYNYIATDDNGAIYYVNLLSTLDVEIVYVDDINVTKSLDSIDNIIPEYVTINSTNYIVSSISTHAYYQALYECYNLSNDEVSSLSMSFYSTYKTIGDYAFYGMSIESLSLNDIETIGNYAFYNTYIGEIDTASNSTSNIIENYAFAESTISGGSISFVGGSVGLYISDYAFYNTDLSNLEYISFNSVSTINSSVFESSILPSSFELTGLVNDNLTYYLYLSSNVFVDTDFSNLEKMIIGESIYIDFSLVDFSNCELSSLEIGKNSYIASNSFSKLSFVENSSIILNGVSYIKEYAFNDVVLNENITLNLMNVSSISSSAFIFTGDYYSSTSNTLDIILGYDKIDGSENYYWGSDDEYGILGSSAYYIENIYISGYMPTSIGSNPFGAQGESIITRVIIGENYSIPSHFFNVSSEEGSKLTIGHLTIGGMNVTINENAFNSSNSNSSNYAIIEDIQLLGEDKGYNTTIMADAFAYTIINDKDIQFENSTINKYGFRNAYFINLESIDLTGVSKVEEGAFSYAIFDGLETLTIENNSNYQVDSLFAYAIFENLSSLIISDGASLSDYMFNGAIFTSLNKIDLNEATVYSYCFSEADLSSLESIDLSNTTITKGSFLETDLSSIETLDFSSTTFEDGYQFSYANLDKLTSIDFEENFVMPEYFFSYCDFSNLSSSFFFDFSGMEIGSFAFIGVTFTDKYILSLDGATEVGSYAFANLETTNLTLDLQNSGTIMANAFSGSSSSDSYLFEVIVGFDNKSDANLNWGSTSISIFGSSYYIEKVSLINYLPNSVDSRLAGLFANITQTSIINMVYVNCDVISSNLFKSDSNKYLVIKGLEVDGVSTISSNAFSYVDFTELEVISLSNVELIEDYAFANLTLGDEITLSLNNVYKIESYAFANLSIYKVIIGFNEYNLEKSYGWQSNIFGDLVQIEELEIINYMFDDLGESCFELTTDGSYINSVTISANLVPIRFFYTDSSNSGVVNIGEINIISDTLISEECFYIAGTIELTIGEINFNSNNVIVDSYAFNGVNLISTTFDIENLTINEYGLANILFSEITVLEVLNAKLIKSYAFEGCIFSKVSTFTLNSSTEIFEGIAHFKNTCFSILYELQITGAFVTTEYMFYQAEFKELLVLVFDTTISEYTFSEVKFDELQYFNIYSATINSYAFKGATFSSLNEWDINAETIYNGTNHFDSANFVSLEWLTFGSGMTLPTEFFANATFAIMTDLYLYDINVGYRSFSNVNFTVLTQIYLEYSTFEDQVFYNALFYKLKEINLTDSAISNSIFTGVDFIALETLILSGATVGAETFAEATFTVLETLELTNTYLSQMAFAGSIFESLTTFTIDKDSQIMASAFEGAVFDLLTELIIYKDTKFETSVFKDALFTSLMTFTLEDSLFVTESMFEGAVFTSLTTLDVSNISLDTWSFNLASFPEVVDFNLKNTVFYSQGAFSDTTFSSLETLEFNATKNIYEFTFYNVIFDSLNSIYIDSATTFVNDSNELFEYDDLINVESIEFEENSTVYAIFKSLKLSSLVSLKVGASSTINASAFYGSEFKENVDIDLNGVKQIYDEAFASIIAQGAVIDIQNISFIGTKAFSSLSTISTFIVGFDSIYVSNSLNPQYSYLWGDSNIGILFNINIDELIIQNLMPQYLGENPFGSNYNGESFIVKINKVSINSDIISNNLFNWTYVSSTNYMSINSIEVSSVNEVGYNAFVNIYIIEEANFNFDDATSIGDKAIYSVYSYSSVNISARNVVSIGAQAFYSLENYSYGSIILGFDEIDSKTSYQYSYIMGGYLGEVTIVGYLPDLSDGLSSVLQNTQISNLTFSDGSNVGNNFFAGVIIKNSSGTSVLSFGGNNSVGNSSFLNSYINGTLTGISNITYFGISAFDGTYFNRLTKLSISNGVTISSSAFANTIFNDLDTITIGNNAVISDSIFKDSTMLVCYSITIGTVDSIGESAFSGVIGSESYVIDVNVSSCVYIYAYAFDSLYFRNISVSGNLLEKIDATAFNDDTESNLESISLSITSSVPTLVNASEIDINSDFRIYVAANLLANYLASEGWGDNNVKDKIGSLGNSSDSSYLVELSNELDGLVILSYIGTDSDVVIPDAILYNNVYVDVVYIKADAFNSNIITSVTLSDNIKYFDSNAFSGINIMEVKVLDSSEYFTQIDGIIYNKDITQLIYYPQYLTSEIYTTLESVVSIANYAVNNANLKTIVLTNIQSLADYAFSYASNLTEFILLSDYIVEITSSNVFNQLYIEETVDKVTTKVRNEAYTLYVPQYMLLQYLEKDIMVYYNIFNYAVDIVSCDYYATYNNFDYINIDNEIYILSYTLPNSSSDDEVVDSTYIANIEIPTSIDGITSISLIGDLYIVLNSVYDEISITVDQEISVKFYSYVTNGTVISGFYSDEDCLIEIDSLTISEKTSIYTATKPSQHSITFNVNYGSYIESITLEYGSTLTLEVLTELGIVATRTGYIFAGWYTDIELTTVLNSIEIVDDINLYAAWSVY